MTPRSERITSLEKRVASLEARLRALEPPERPRRLYPIPPYVPNPREPQKASDRTTYYVDGPKV